MDLVFPKTFGYLSLKAHTENLLGVQLCVLNFFSALRNCKVKCLVLVQGSETQDFLPDHIPHPYPDSTN